MSRGKTLTVFLAADLKRFNSGMKQAGGQVEGFGGKLNKYLGPALAAAGVAAGAFATKLAADSVAAASDLEESLSKASVVFGEQADAVIAWSKTSSTAFGQSQQQALEAAGTYGNLLQAFGVTTEAASEMSTTMVQLAADLASFNNTPIDQAIDAIRSGLSGETEPLKRFGVALTDARLRAEALAMGLNVTSGALDAGTKAQAAYGLILKDTTLAQGDFARTSDGLANTQRTVQAAVEDAQAAIGKGLVDAIGEAIDAMGGAQGLVKTIEEGADVFVNFTEGVGDLAKQLNDLAPEIDTTTGKLTTLMGEAQNQFGYAALLDLPGAIADIIDTTRVLVDEQYKQDKIQAILNEEIKENLDYLDPMARGMHAAARAADDLASSTADAAIGADAASRSLLDMAIASGQVPEKARWSQRFDIKEMLEGIGRGARSAAGGTRAYSSAASDSEKILEKQKSALMGTQDQLLDQIQTLKDATQAVEDYAASIQQDLLAGFDIGGLYEGALNEQGEFSADQFFQSFDQAINRAEWFGSLLNELKNRNIDQRLIEDLASLGPDAGGELAQRMISDAGFLGTFVDKWTDVQETTRQLALGLVPEFLEAGRLQAIDNLNGMLEQFQKDQRKFAKLGRRLGQQVGATFKAQIAKDVADAVRAVEAAATAARAEAVARAEAQQARITEQAVATAISNLIRNSDQRAGRNPQPVLQ